eukprot:m.98043 g.98043  ORF g.98043 m.98043 type:complete len:93 (+) comp20550_c2_seq13:3059-3337(+)
MRCAAAGASEMAESMSGSGLLVSDEDVPPPHTMVKSEGWELFADEYKPYFGAPEQNSLGHGPKQLVSSFLAPLSHAHTMIRSCTDSFPLVMI